MKIRLRGQNGLGLLIPCKTGITYHCQTGGIACRQNEVEGVYVPLYGSRNSYEQKHLDNFFTPPGPKYRQCEASIDEETAVFLEGLLARNGYARALNIKIDRTKFSTSREAWVHVTFEAPSNSNSIIDGFESGPAVLTWLNSD